MGDLALAVSTAVLVEAINLTLVLYHRAPELSLGDDGGPVLVRHGADAQHQHQPLRLVRLPLRLCAPEASAILSRVSARLGRLLLLTSSCSIGKRVDGLTLLKHEQAACSGHTWS